MCGDILATVAVRLFSGRLFAFTNAATGGPAINANRRESSRIEECITKSILPSNSKAILGSWIPQAREGAQL
jgi:hypothetical protein